MSPAGAWSTAASLTHMVYVLGNRSAAHFDLAVAFGDSDVYDPHTKCVR